ncbi:MAG: septal ring lytic transglycosylase RlpA family protein, partial [Bacteroidia bacterium]|nr:septal ring lytic transglycosylase RlpA family protein [Bacteroidia bacterium]
MKEVSYGLLFILFIFQPLYAQYGPGYKERGIISYYTDKYAERKSKTANEEEFDNNDLIGCHNRIPFNSKVKVTNLANGKSVVVRINDRGPYAYGRIMDISRAAAEKIGLIATGTAKVDIEVVEDTQLAKQTEGEKPVETKPAPAENEPPKIVTATNESDYLSGNTYSQWGAPRDPQGHGVQVG